MLYSQLFLCIIAIRSEPGLPKPKTFSLSIQLFTVQYKIMTPNVE